MILTETGIQQDKNKEKCGLHAETGIQQGILITDSWNRLSTSIFQQDLTETGIQQAIGQLID